MNSTICTRRSRPQSLFLFTFVFVSSEKWKIRKLNAHMTPLIPLTIPPLETKGAFGSKRDFFVSQYECWQRINAVMSSDWRGAQLWCNLISQCCVAVVTLLLWLNEQIVQTYFVWIWIKKESRFPTFGKCRPGFSTAIKGETPHYWYFMCLHLN